MKNKLTIEGKQFKAKEIHRQKLITIWEVLTKESFPKIAAFQLEDKDFDIAMELMKKSDCCKEDERREIEEWGKTLTSKGTDAIVFNTDEFPNIDYMILVRENPYHSLTEILKHELKHIIREDF